MESQKEKAEVSLPIRSSVMFPTCARADYLRLKTFDRDMVVINNASLCSETQRMIHGMEVFMSEGREQYLWQMAMRFSLYSGWKYFLYNDPDGKTYFVDPSSGEKQMLGDTLRGGDFRVVSGKASVLYDEDTREIGHIPRMLLGYTLAYTPGLRECWKFDIPIEAAITARNSEKKL